MKTIEIQVFNEKTGSYEDKQMDAEKMIGYAKENTHGSATYAYAVHSYLKELGYDFSLKYANQIANKAMIAIYGKDNLSKKQINLGAAGNSYTYQLREDFENGIVDFQAVKDLIASDISAWQIESDTGISRTTLTNYRNGKASLLNMTVKNAMILTNYAKKLEEEKMIKNDYDVEIEFETAAQYMNEDLREELHATLAPCSNQEFFDAYARAHEERFSEEWFVNTADPML